jgi:hypothetical protein
MDGHFPLQVFPFRLEIETEGRFRAPEYQGSLFRGGFGKYFRELSCVTRAPVCDGCDKRHVCPYSMVFETPVDPSRATVLRKYPNAPHPFVLAPEINGFGILEPRTKLNLHIALFGSGSVYLPHFLSVFEHMGQEGRFGGKFRLVRADSACKPELIFDGAGRRLLRDPAVWNWPAEPEPATELWLEFLTPLRMRTGGIYNRKPSFPEITQTLLRRIHLLRALYGDGMVDTGWTAPLLKAADNARVLQAEWRVFEWDRNSGRQGRRVEMDGVLGSMRVQGELTELARWFRLGEWVHMGNGTSMGLGRYRLTVE